MIRKFFLMVFLLTTVSISTVFADFDASIKQFTYDNLDRQYYLHVPDTEINSLLIVLHPFGSNGRAMQYLTGLNDFADHYGFAVAYPDSIDAYWDDGRIAEGMPPDVGQFDDAGFISSLAGSLRGELGVDSVYLTGLENGGALAFRIACEAPQTFEAIIPVAVMMWEYHRDNCTSETSSVDMFLINGAENPQYVPDGEDIEYLVSGLTFAWLGWQDTVDIWREHNQCPDSDLSVLDNDLTIYSDCADDSSVTLWTIPKAGYNWARMADNSLNRFGVDVSAVISAYITGSDWQSLTEPEFASTVQARSWIMYVPSTYDESQAAPLVVNLHGKFSNAPSQAFTSNFASIAEREGIIVLYPNGIDNQWNYLPGVYDIDPVTHSDEAFIRSLINDLDIDLNIDRNRMYVTGLSNGGFMTQRLACTMQDEFSAFASVAATAPFGINVMCEDAKPAPIMYIMGTADTNVPWRGRISQDVTGRPYYSTYPMEDSLNFWAIHNHCTAEYETRNLPVVDPETTTTVLTFTDCAPESTVILYGIQGGGHVWPGTRSPENDFLGQNTQDFNASEVIQEFFSQYSLNTETDN